jgi:hypothetical protein
MNRQVQHDDKDKIRPEHDFAESVRGERHEAYCAAANVASAAGKFSALPEEFQFRDWWKRQNNTDWVEVAQGNNQELASYWGTSWLVPDSREAIDQTFIASAFDVDFRDGLPGFGRMGMRDEILYLPNGMFPGQPEPFVIWREFHDLYPPEITILQEFVFYHRLYFDAASQAHIEPISQAKVIEYFQDPVLIRVRRDHLRDFLAARKRILVRGFDNRLRLTLREVPQLELPFRNAQSRFDLWVRPETLSWGKSNALVRMFGKYIVRPYVEPKHEAYKSQKREVDAEDERVPLIIGADDNGNAVEARSDGDAEFLTPVFFRRELLQRYYNNPRLYKVEPSLIRYIDQWGIDYGINDSGLVHVWLGDFWQTLPSEEQLYWKSFNVTPSGGIEASFFQNQIAAEFADTEREDYKLLRAREALDDAWQRRFKFRLFRPIPHHENYVLSSLHIPTSTELREFSEQISYLAKALVEALDKARLEQEVTAKENLNDDKGQKKASIATLEVFLSERNLDKSGEPFCQQLRWLQSVRSKLPAHLTSRADLTALFAKGGFSSEMRLPEIFTEILAVLAEAMEQLTRPLAANVTSD